MTENSTADIGRAAIDSYLDTVEQALIAARAPRGDRVQVLHDLESQIADMLAQEPAPLTENVVHAVLAKLEPPSHFAAMYGNGKQPHVSWPNTVTSKALDRIRWSRVALASFTLPFVGTFLELLIAVSGGRAYGAILHLSIIAGLVLTPCALAMAYRQLRTQPDRFPDRNFVFNMIIGFAVVGPAFVMIVLAEWTYALVFIPFGIVAFFYWQYKLVRRLKQKLHDKLPPGPESASANGDPLHEAPSLGTSMSPAVM